MLDRSSIVNKKKLLRFGQNKLGSCRPYQSFLER
jgi:hypothetical protein